MSQSTDKWAWLGLPVFLAGLWLPLVFVDFDDGSTQQEAWAAIFASMSVFTFAAARKIGSAKPRLKKWATESILGGAVLLFIFTFMASGMSALFAVMPVPGWLHGALALSLGVAALVLFCFIS